MTEKEFMLNIDGKYLIKIADAEDTVGVFKGYSALGSETALAVEIDGGRMRFVPVSQILFIDVLESGTPEEPKPAKKRDIYYG